MTKDCIDSSRGVPGSRPSRGPGLIGIGRFSRPADQTGGLAQRSARDIQFALKFGPHLPGARGHAHCLVIGGGEGGHGARRAVTRFQRLPRTER